MSAPKHTPITARGIALADMEVRIYTESARSERDPATREQLKAKARHYRTVRQNLVLRLGGFAHDRSLRGYVPSTKARVAP